MWRWEPVSQGVEGLADGVDGSVGAMVGSAGGDGIAGSDGSVGIDGRASREGSGNDDSAPPQPATIIARPSSTTIAPED